jgi:LCP family protein required for cell wall assembly
MKYKHKASTSEDSPPTKPDYVVETWDKTPPSPRQRGFRRVINVGCSIVGIVFLCILVVSSIYFLIPFRTNLLILGIDRTPEGTDLGRSDTNILMTVLPLRPYVGLVSIPRDLWVTIPGVGENRINTAHFFAENQLTGSGPMAAMETMRTNFGVSVNHYLRIKFNGIVEIIDALDGLDIELTESLGNLPAGKHHLSGDQALVFLRDRQGTDDFHRMGQGQVFVLELFEQVIHPASWMRLPAVLRAISNTVDTNLPIWIWPRIGFAMLRSGTDGIDSRVIGRDFVTPFTTPDGAQVLLPQWELINPLIEDVFFDQR